MTVPLDETQSALRRLVESACPIVPPARFSQGQSHYGIAFYDTERDGRFTHLSDFADAVSALESDPAVCATYGQANAIRLSVQFVYNTCKLLDAGIDVSRSFDDTWAAFVAETADPDWQFVGIANLTHFSYEGEIADLGYGVSIRGRSFEWLRESLGWDDVDLSRLTDDWSAGGQPSSYILVVTTSQPKTADNCILSSDGLAQPLAARALSGMRLCGSGQVHIGRMFLSRPARFNVGVGGRSMSGFSIWRHGLEFKLTDAMLPQIRDQIATLSRVEGEMQKNARHVGLALRSFTSMFDRLFGQAEDCVLDAITALEALWKLDSELSFRLAFRTSSLLAINDNDRDSIFETLRTYYRIRSKTVHGTSLSEREWPLVQNDEPLRTIVRRTLRAFIHLLDNPTDWTLRRLSDDPDRVLLHSEKRAELQQAMGI